MQAPSKINAIDPFNPNATQLPTGGDKRKKGLKTTNEGAAKTTAKVVIASGQSIDSKSEGQAKQVETLGNKVEDLSLEVKRQINEKPYEKKEDPTPTVMEDSGLIRGEENKEGEAKKQIDEEQMEDLPSLKDLVSDLSEEAQKAFNIEIRQQLEKVAGFESNFSKDNRLYERNCRSLDKSPTLRENYRQLRETEQKTYRTIDTQYKMMDLIFKERIKILQMAIQQHSLENKLLIEITHGNDSYFSGFSISNLGSQRYGSKYRLSQIQESLLNKKDKILKESSERELDRIILPIFNQVTQDTTQISLEVDILKEEVTIYNEALKKEAYDEVLKSGLPKLYYLYHKQQLENLKVRINQLAELQKNRIQELNEVIEREKGNPESSQYMDAQLERAEISKRIEMTNRRFNETEKLLNQRAYHFSLSEEVINSKETVTIEELSEECGQALDLLKRITSKKEVIFVRPDTWDKLATPDQKYKVFQQDFEETERLQNEANELLQEDEKKETALSKRKKFLESAIEIYTGSIRTMQESIKTIEERFQILKKENEIRGKWNLAAAKD